MIVHISEDRIKRNAKRLKRALCALGFEVTLSRCQDLSAQMVGLNDFHDYRTRSLHSPLSPYDEDLSDRDLAARFALQLAALSAAGYSAVATALLDRVNPTARSTAGSTRRRQPRRDLEGR